MTLRHDQSPQLAPLCLVVRRPPILLWHLWCFHVHPSPITAAMTHDTQTRPIPPTRSAAFVPPWISMAFQLPFCFSRFKSLFSSLPTVAYTGFSKDHSANHPPQNAHPSHHIELIERSPQYSVPGPAGLLSNFTDEQYCAAVQAAIEYIHAGDIYQVNLSQRLVHPQSTANYPIIHVGVTSCMFWQFKFQDIDVLTTGSCAGNL